MKSGQTISTHIPSGVPTMRINPQPIVEPDRMTPIVGATTTMNSNPTFCLPLTHPGVPSDTLSR